MTGRPSGRCAATEALKTIRPEVAQRAGLDGWPWAREVLAVIDAALASPCCVTGDQEQVKEALERYEQVAEQPWSFHQGSLRERLEWCKAQHAYYAVHPPEEPMTREAKQDFDRACVTWYDEMLGQLAELDLRQAHARVLYIAEHLLQRVDEFTGVIGPAGEREDDYIRDSIGRELDGYRAALALLGSNEEEER